METRYKIAAAAIVTISVLGAGLAAAFPMGFGRFGDELTAEELESLHQEHQEMKEVIENGDYETWKTMMEDRIDRMKSELTEENFEKIVERHGEMQERKEIRNQIREALENEDYETANSLREQLFENSPPGKFGRFGRMGMGL